MSTNKIFPLNYADRGDNKNTLVIGYKKWGHDFKYKSKNEIERFIESLK